VQVEVKFAGGGSTNTTALCLVQNVTATGAFSCSYALTAAGLYKWNATAMGEINGINMNTVVSSAFTFTTPSISSVTLTTPATGSTLTSTYIALTGKVATSTTTALHEVQVYLTVTPNPLGYIGSCLNLVQNLTAAGTFSCNYNVEEAASYTWYATAEGKIGGINMTGSTSTYPANDNYPTSSTFTFSAGPVVQNITLVAGWNLISLPLIPANTAIGSVLASQDAGANLTSVWSYQGGYWKYATFNPTTHMLSGSLTTMQDGYGYWVYMTKPDNLIVLGSIFAPPPATPSSYSLSVGWNLIGFKPQPTVQNETVAQYLTSITGSYDQNNVWIYENSIGTWSRASDSAQIRPGEALWVLMTASATLRP